MWDIVREVYIITNVPNITSMHNGFKILSSKLLNLDINATYGTCYKSSQFEIMGIDPYGVFLILILLITKSKNLKRFETDFKFKVLQTDMKNSL